MTTTIAPTAADLQKKITKLQRDNDALVDAKLDLEAEVESLRENQQDGDRAHETGIDRLQRIVVGHHDESRHRGSVRFCTEAPCPALNALLDDGDLL